MSKNLKFIDLFAGIGGFRLGMEKNGFQCVYSCEIDDHACEVYKSNYGTNPKGDITKLDPNSLPDFDVLCAGFPCQTFSICGLQKGFYDSQRGTLFYDIYRILNIKQPIAFILENVQYLENHENGHTLCAIIQDLNKLGYSVTYKILNARDFGVPQNRKRIIIIGNKDGKLFDFDKIQYNTVDSMKPFLDSKGDFEYLKPEEYTILENYKKQPDSGLIFIGYRNKKIRTTGVREGTEHLSRVHKQPNRIYSSMGIHPTIASQEQSGRYWILDEGKVRKLTLNECFKFMGFPNFYYSYKSQGASILPVIALYSIYECMMLQMDRYHNKILEPLESHNSSDKNSGAAGDIIIKDETGKPFEVIEVKFDIPINYLMVMDAYEKIKSTQIQRYYILSTSDIVPEEMKQIQMSTYEIGIEHGCQMIISNVFSSLHYYLRLLNNTDDFIDKYMKNLENNPELNYEHKIAWNIIIKN